MLTYSESTQERYPWTRPDEVAPGHVIVRVLELPDRWVCTCGAQSDRDDAAYRTHDAEALQAA